MAIAFTVGIRDRLFCSEQERVCVCVNLMCDFAGCFLLLCCIQSHDVRSDVFVCRIRGQTGRDGARDVQRSSWRAEGGLAFMGVCVMVIVYTYACVSVRVCVWRMR